jgi:hypothetical protein
VYCSYYLGAPIRTAFVHSSSTPHAFASLALHAGRSIRWVADQLGHANPELTLRVYAHALREEETDLGFLDFGGTKRHPRGTSPEVVGTPPPPYG